jgi:hypothetical protein
LLLNGGAICRIIIGQKQSNVALGRGENWETIYVFVMALAPIQKPDIDVTGSLQD